MPRIIGIETAKRRSGWMEVQLDDASSFVLPQDQVLSLGISEGNELDHAGLILLERAAQRAEAMRIALHYLSVGPRSRRQLSIRLYKGGVDRAVGDATCERCQELGYLDDSAFAAAFARDRIRFNPCGVRRMTQDLREKGVIEADALAGIEEAMHDERVSEGQLLGRAANRRVGRLGALAPEVAGRRLFAFLTRRGFAASEVRRWIDRWQEGQEGG